MLGIRGLHGRFLNNRLTDLSSGEATALGSALATRRYKERPGRINTHEVSIYSGGGSWEG